MSMPMESLPGLSLTSFGFMDDRYMVFFSLWADPFLNGTSFIPQMGQSPGLSCTICGCIGQV